MYVKSAKLLLKLQAFLFLAMSFDLAYTMAHEAGLVGNAIVFLIPVYWMPLFMIAVSQILSPLNYEGDYLFFFFQGFVICLIGFALMSVFAVALFWLVNDLENLTSSEGSLLHRFLYISAMELSFLFIALSIGTMLPALAGGYGKGIIAALKRSKSVFLFTFRHMMLGPVTLTTIYSCSLLFLEHFSIIHPELFSGAGGPNFSLFFAIFIGYLVFGLATVMTASILSEAYLKAEKRLQYSEI